MGYQRIDSPASVLSSTFAALEVFDPMLYGAIGDGVANDTTAVQAAVAAWLVARSSAGTAYPGVLHFRAGRSFRIDPITIAPPVGATGVFGGLIEGAGSRIVSTDTTTPAITISTHGSGVAWQNIAINDLRVEGRGIKVVAGASEFIWNVTIRRPFITKAKGSAIELDGVFEASIDTPYLETQPTGYTPASVADSCIYIHKGTGSAQPSSIDISNPTCRGGWNGIHTANGADVKVRGGTVLGSTHEGIYINAVGATVRDVHVENVWLGGSVDGTNAAIRLEGSGVISGALLIANSSAGMSPYVGQSACERGVRVYAYGVDTTGSVTAGRIDVSGISYVTNIPGAKTLLTSGGEAGSILTHSGIDSMNSSGSGIRLINLTPTAKPAQTCPPLGTTNVTAIGGSSNRCVYVRAKGDAYSVSQLNIYVGTQSGNISVALYRNSGSEGLAARPTGSRIATTGDIACPASGLATLTLDGTVNVYDGDWFAITCDNTTATFLKQLLNYPAGGAGVSYSTSSSHPAPSTVGSLTAAYDAFWIATV